MEWITLSSTTILKDRWINLRADECQMPNGDIVAPFYVLQYANWANALALTKEQQVILIRQYRHGLGRTIVELPGGNFDPSETPEQAIRRELLEETGYDFEQIILTSKLSPNPANQSNYCYSFLALGGKKVQSQALERYEDIKVELYTLEELENMIHRQELVHALHVTSVFYGLQMLKKLDK